MTTTVLPARVLTVEHMQAWARWQGVDAALDSPFFRPEFTLAVAAVRDDVEVAIVAEGGEPVGFFPFQRSCCGAGRPVGGRLSDFHGLVGRPDLSWDVRGLLRACRLACWEFDHLPASQEALKPAHFAVVDSPYLDLSAGFDDYLIRVRGESELPTQTLRKARKIEREAGPLRFTFHDSDPAAFARLREWKSAQYIRSRAPDVLSFPWTVKLLEQVLAQQTEDFAGVLSTLHVGDRLAAAHLCLRSGKVLHSWFPAYDPFFARYSPGNILLLEMARAAPGQGVGRIDLGRGEKNYKNSFMSAATPVAEGFVAAVPLLGPLRRAYHRARGWGRSSRLGGPWRLVGRWTRSLRGALAFR